MSYITTRHKQYRYKPLSHLTAASLPLRPHACSALGSSVVTSPPSSPSLSAIFSDSKLKKTPIRKLLAVVTADSWIPKKLKLAFKWIWQIEEIL